MARRTSAGGKGKSSQTKRGNGSVAGRATKRTTRGKRSLLSRLKFW